MTFPVQPGILLAQDIRPLVRRNDGLNAPHQQIINEILSRIAPIRNQSLKIKALEQCLSLLDIVALPRSQTQPQGIAQPIYSDMDFAAKAAPTPTQRLFPVFFRHPPHRDAPAQSCCQSSHFPYLHPRQRWSASVPRPRLCTTARSACRYYSTGHTRLALSAMVRHFGLTHFTASTKRRQARFSLPM